MQIGGWQKFTALDYPDHLAATVFTVGCNFRCPFCHNGEIVTGKGEAHISEEEVFAFLRERQGELEGLCISGGEPTLQEDLPAFASRVKELGFKVKLDTNGSHPQVVGRLLDEELVDYFAIDVKTDFARYDRVGAPTGSAEAVLRSIEIIMKRGVALELRTTVAPQVVEAGDFGRIIETFKEQNENILPYLYRYGVQGFRPQKCLDESWQELTPYGDEVLEEIAQKLRAYCPRVDVLK